MVEKVGNGPQIQNSVKIEERRDGQAFDKMLGRVMGKAAKAAETQLTPSAGPVANPAGVMLNVSPPHVAQAEHTLDIMDRLAAALTDPSYTPKKAEQLINNLDREADKLLATAEKLEGTDRSADLLKNTALLAKVQVAKFNRGDLI